jgi:hypothetical protein
VTNANRAALLLVLAALAVALAAVAPAGAAKATHRSCPAYSFKHNGVPWHAASVRTLNAPCTTATRLIRAYATPRNCQFRTACHISGYVCRTSDADGATFSEACVRTGRSVRWRGSYVSS